MHATMEHMTIWGLISEASLLVKAVMVTLLLTISALRDHSSRPLAASRALTEGML